MWYQDADAIELMHINRSLQFVMPGRRATPESRHLRAANSWLETADDANRRIYLMADRQRPIDECRTLKNSGVNLENLISYLRKQGCWKIDTIAILREVRASASACETHRSSQLNVARYERERRCAA
jgi:hypothetical protein